MIYSFSSVWNQSSVSIELYHKLGSVLQHPPASMKTRLTLSTALLLLFSLCTFKPWTQSSWPCRKQLFSDRMSAQLCPDFLLLHTTHTSELGLVQQAEAGCNEDVSLKRSHVFVNRASTPASALITKSSLGILVDAFCMAPLIHPEIIVSLLFSFLRLSGVRNIINTTYRGFPAVFTHFDFGAGQTNSKTSQKNSRASDLNICITCSSSGECLEIIWSSVPVWKKLCK